MYRRFISLSPFIQLLKMCLYHYRLLGIYCIVCIIINTVHFGVHIVPALAIRGSFFWFVCPFDMPPSFALETLLSGITRCS